MAEKQEFKPGNRKYNYAVGRRKEAVAQVRLYGKGSGKFVVNGRTLSEYFQNPLLEQTAVLPLRMSNLMDEYDATIAVKGGGKRGQSDAVSLAIARALTEVSPELRPVIKKAGLLTRDSRVKERKKYGLKRARRAPQWSKR